METVAELSSLSLNGNSEDPLGVVTEAGLSKSSSSFTLSVGGFFNGGNGSGQLLVKRSANMTECVPVPSLEHVAEIVGRQGK